MHQVIEAMINEAGQVFLKQPARFPEARRALVIILDDSTLPPETVSGRPTPGELRSEGATRYRIESALVAGGMGQTFIGTDTQSGRTVCIKRLRDGIRSNVIDQEWRSLARVNSRYVVRF